MQYVSQLALSYLHLELNLQSWKPNKEFQSQFYESQQIVKSAPDLPEKQHASIFKIWNPWKNKL